jgi:asparagine synthase (glutamine-hydrolysing)
MQLFAAAMGIPSMDSLRLGAAVGGVSDAFPHLDASDLWTAESPSGQLALAALAHPADACGPRRYRAHVGDVVVLLDGLPIDRRNRRSAHQADVLLRHWDEVSTELEGQFVVARVDVGADRLDCVTDTLGMNPLFCVEVEGGRAISNSAEVLRRAFGLEEPDPLGVSTFLSLGWAADDRTLLERVRTLRGGHRYRIGRDSLVAEAYLTPASVVPKNQRRVSTQDVARSLEQLTAAAALPGVPVRCALTAGRDSRLLAALLRSAGVSASYYTIGRDGDMEVELARRVARTLGVPYEVWPGDVARPAGGDWPALARIFLGQTDGLSSLAQIVDYGDQLDPVDVVGVKFWGVGGELTRGCGTLPRALASNLPLARHSGSFQEVLLRSKAQAFDGLLTADAVQTARDHVHRFVLARRREGWRNPELSEAFHAFERIARWGSSGVRRTSGTDDVFTPFCSRAFMEYAYGLTLQESCIEATQYQLLTLLAPEVRDLPFEEPWPRQRPARAGLGVTARAARTAAGLLTNRLNGRGPLARPSRGAEAAAGEQPPALVLLEAHLDAFRELCGSAPTSPLWDYVEREALEAALNATPEARAPMADVLIRVLTLFWYFHDPGRTRP